MRIIVATKERENYSCFSGVKSPIGGRESTKYKVFEGVTKLRGIEFLYEVIEEVFKQIQEEDVKSLIVPVYIDRRVKKLITGNLPDWYEASLPNKDKLFELRRLNNIICPDWRYIRSLSSNEHYLAALHRVQHL